MWTWQLAPAPDGTSVTVVWELYPKTFFRKLIAVRIRQRQLESEVRASLAAAAAAVRSASR